MIFRGETVRTLCRFDARFEYAHSIYAVRQLQLTEVCFVRVKVKLFAAFRDIVGKKEEDLDVKDGITVQMLLEDYIRRFPQMGRFREHIILSVNKEYGAPGKVLREGDEVSFLPPVSGG